jgi:membrane fusion protein (multidrug efflux system)
MRKGIVLIAAIAGIGALALAASPGMRGAIGAEKTTKAAPKAAAPGAVTVEATTARLSIQRSDMRAVGSLASDESVQIAAEIAGRIAHFAFKEGQSVAAGADLISLDDALARAEVADAKARFDLAYANRERARQLSKTGNVTERAQDEAVANLETSRAALELANVRLSKHYIKAPFAGMVGLRKVSVGAYVSVGSPIVNLEKIDVLKVNFKLPEMVLADISIGQKVDVEVDALPGRTFSAEIYAIDPQVDVNGRALQIRARMDNPDLVLRPGLFARILVKGRTTREVVSVPESAIVPRGGDMYVYQVQDGKAVEAKVTLGQRGDGMVQITSGLSPNAVVVVAGQLKLRNGAVVEVVQAPQPARPEKNS